MHSERVLLPRHLASQQTLPRSRSRRWSRRPRRGCPEETGKRNREAENEVEHSDRPDVVLGLVFETVDTAVQREFCRPPDQAVLALARSPRLGRVVIADPWRSGPVDFAKGRSCRQHSTEQVREVRVERVHPRRLRRSDPLSDEKLEQSYTRYKREIGRLGGFSVDSGAVFVTYHPLRLPGVRQNGSRALFMWVKMTSLTRVQHIPV